MTDRDANLAAFAAWHDWTVYQFDMCPFCGTAPHDDDCPMSIVFGVVMAGKDTP